MHTGMLWFDNSDRPIFTRIEGGLKHYEKKHGRKPTLILVHPSMLKSLQGEKLEVNGIEVRAYRPVLPGHIWIGIADESEAK